MTKSVKKPYESHVSQNLCVTLVQSKLFSFVLNLLNELARIENKREVFVPSSLWRRIVGKLQFDNIIQEIKQYGRRICLFPPHSCRFL